MRLYSLFIGLSVVATSCGNPTGAVEDVPYTEQALEPAAPPTLDAEIQSMVAAVNPTTMNSNLLKLVGFGTRNSCSSTTSSTQGIGAARTWVRDQYIAAGVSAAFDSFTSSFCGFSRTHRNVYAWIPGTDPTRIVLVGGHLDSRSTNSTSPTQAAPGANDSGSQTSVVLAAARAMAGKTFLATVVFVSFVGEEQGLLGSKNFVSKIGTYFPGATVEAALINDIVGGDVSANNATSLQQFRVFSPGTPRERSSSAPTGSTDDTSPARGLMRAVALASDAYVPAMAIQPNLRQDRPGRGSDHISFLDSRIPGVRFIETLENTAHQHNSSDTIANMTPAYMARVAQVIVASASSLARAPSAPRSVSVSGSAATSVSLSWTAPLSGVVDHYVIAARPVGSNFYVQRVEAEADATSATLTAADLGIPPNTAFFVSVAAVDAAGHESLFAYPEYRCDSVCEIQAGSLDVTTSI